MKSAIYSYDDVIGLSAAWLDVEAPLYRLKFALSNCDIAFLSYDIAILI
jgi:hypothetical protein